VTPDQEPSELTTSSILPSKEPPELTSPAVAPGQEWSEFTAAPMKKKALAPVLIND
jgi:hypothetical protein